MNRKTILIVDDDSDILDVMCHFLMASGFKVKTASSGDAAHELLDSEIDAVVADLAMPNGNGLELRDRAKERGKPVVFFSGFPEAYKAHLHSTPVVEKPGIYDLVEQIKLVVMKRAG